MDNKKEESWLNQTLLENFPKLIKTMQFHIDHPVSEIRICSMDVLHPDGTIYFLYYDLTDIEKPILGWNRTAHIKELV